MELLRKCVRPSPNVEPGALDHKYWPPAKHFYRGHYRRSADSPMALQWIAGIILPMGLEEHDRQAVSGEARPLITRVTGAYGRAVESAAGDLLLQDLGKAAQV